MKCIISLSNTHGIHPEFAFFFSFVVSGWYETSFKLYHVLTDEIHIVKIITITMKGHQGVRI